MDNQRINRIESEVSQWRNKEERFAKLFSFSLSNNKGLLAEKLRYYEKLAAKYKNTPDLDERLTLRVLRQERNQIEKQLYPNLSIRLLRRLLVVPLREYAALRQESISSINNSQSLQNQLQRTGFTGLTEKLEAQMSQGLQKFTLPVSYYVNEKERVDHRLSFEKDPSGQYRFEGFQTSLYNASKPEEIRQHFFDAKTGPDANLAYNLLSGRAVFKDNLWSQLDFNDKDANGSYRVKEFHAGYGFDLDKALQQLPIKGRSNMAVADKLNNALKAGGRESVSFEIDGKEKRYYIEANPQFKSLTIYDGHSKKINLATITGSKITDALKVVNKLNEVNDTKLSQKKHLRLG